LPELTDALYGEYFRSGERLSFERVYFERRRRLGRAAAALLLSRAEDVERPRLVESFVRKLRDVFAEESWALPAHVNSAAGGAGGKEPLCIDLFSAETACLMADLLEVFDAVIPAELKTRVRARLRREIFENYATGDFRWLRMTSNWNAVCHRGVLGAALALLDDVDLLAAMLARAREFLPAFLTGFTSDGGCSEGPAYWNYGFGWYAWLNERLEHRTGGGLSLFEGDAFVREIARFGPAMSLAGGQLVNFSECAPAGGLDPAILAYLGKRLDEPSCGAAAAEHYRLLLERGADWHALRTDFLHLSRWLLRFEPAPEQSGAIPGDRYLPELAVWVSRWRDGRAHGWEFAAKAGHNGERHNHNGCGSFLLNIDGRRVPGGDRRAPPRTRSPAPPAPGPPPAPAHRPGARSARANARGEKLVASRSEKIARVFAPRPVAGACAGVLWRKRRRGG
jgi:hypothetical protein